MNKVVEAGQLKLAILASGRGSNFDAICDAIVRQELNAEIKVLISDKKDALVLEKAQSRGIETRYLNPKEYSQKEDYEQEIVKILQECQVNVIALAGYMRLVGKVLLKAYKYRILNIHPSLLPSFTGLQAQKQALDYGVRYSGCTVHLVDEGMDTGPIIMQAVVPVYQDDTEETLAQRILQEEHKVYWRSLQLMAEGRVNIEGRKVYII